MATDLISYLLKDKLEEFSQEKEVLEAQLEAQNRKTRDMFHQAIEDIIIARFPAAPALLTRRIRTINDPARLQP